MYKTSDFRGNACDPRMFSNSRGQRLFEDIRNSLPAALKKAGIPANVEVDEAKSGGMFGSKVPLLVIKYPNPPTQFFYIGIMVNDNVVSFPLLGESVQNTKMNKKADLEKQGSFLRAAMVKPDELILQQEHAWQAAVIKTFESLIITE